MKAIVIHACAACGAVQKHRLIRCEQCGKPLVFPHVNQRPRAAAIKAARRAIGGA